MNKGDKARYSKKLVAVMVVFLMILTAVIVWLCRNDSESLVNVYTRAIGFFGLELGLTALVTVLGKDKPEKPKEALKTEQKLSAPAVNKAAVNTTTKPPNEWG